MAEERRRLTHVWLHVWSTGDDPMGDAPEQFSVKQPTLEETKAFVCAAIEKHWNGECGCQEDR